MLQNGSVYGAMKWENTANYGYILAIYGPYFCVHSDGRIRTRIVWPGYPFERRPGVRIPMLFHRPTWHKYRTRLSEGIGRVSPSFDRIEPMSHPVAYPGFFNHWAYSQQTRFKAWASMDRLVCHWANNFHKDIKNTLRFHEKSMFYC